ncbi:cytochrome C oxidase subunit IV family protein [Pseudodesulfovibrio methanolicus]|uniref:Cytochrome C oxidase subunit IV family protein n=1 Tax=Pseudodesulfovibrio methanolicus TaxID=3126690 RepID=A0ABZ2J688_9BACT
MNEHEQTKHHGPGYGLFIAVWAALMVLTAITVEVSTIHLGFLNVVSAMTIASIKASLVVFFFMHLKYENRTLKTMVLVAFVILAIFIGFTFFDTANR